MAVHTSVSITAIVIAAALSIAFGPAAVAAEVPPSAGTAAFAIQVPPGLSVDVLFGQGDKGSATMTGCPVSGIADFHAEFHYLVDGNTVALPILFTPEIPVLPDGVATVPLAPISAWLAGNMNRDTLPPSSSVVLTSSCFRPVSETEPVSVVIAQATRIIPASSVSLEGPPPPVPSGTSGTPLPPAGPAGDAEPSASVSATPAPVLATTGYSAAAGLTGLGALMSLAGVALVARRGRRPGTAGGSARELLSPHRAQQTEDPGCG